MFGIVGVAAITVICYLVGLGCKAAPKLKDNLIPVIVGIIGLLLGLLAFFIRMPDFPATDPITAAGVGVVSGLAATGTNQIIKQIGGMADED